LEVLVAADVTRSVQGECRDGRVRGARLLTSGLRSLLHYPHLEGRSARQLASVVAHHCPRSDDDRTWEPLAFAQSSRV